MITAWALRGLSALRRAGAAAIAIISKFQQAVDSSLSAVAPPAAWQPGRWGSQKCFHPKRQTFLGSGARWWSCLSGASGDDQRGFWQACSTASRCWLASSIPTFFQCQPVPARGPAGGCLEQLPSAPTPQALGTSCSSLA